MSALSASLGGGGLRSLLPGSAAEARPESLSPSLSAPVRTLTPPSQLSDLELIDGCLAGSRLMQKYLYERFAGRMMAVCLRYAQTTFEAEDVLQEGFLTVFKNLASFRRECPLEFWIRRIMVNAALRQHRRNAPLVAVSDGGEYPEDLVGEEFTLSNYNFEELLSMIQDLAPRYRMVFNLFAIEGYGHKEIGDMLGISEGTSKSQYSRARAILKSKIERLDAHRTHGSIRS
ncbi:sigma-70 family RNA polymerase sigma factor [Hymenobacter sp. HSC-4F20]|uniref:RNA polymerase sigma factor n=1 Tax=Hymenobacter sp. HSC-4F20 TaxID=2864135 RepID=UPI001C73D994|nr:sigma-70 family RNA polymerase sigma factor [Hymenobacter sp. HSC-4F20]MBX0291276.1 sigma-70 family RNA polymerase sigma factor [Hymenobacter sp. HSC-4F20]